MIVDGVYYIPSDALLPGIDKTVLKDDELFVILDAAGDSPRIYGRELGFYYRDTRFLDTWELLMHGEAPTALAREARVPVHSYLFEMTNRDVQSLDYDGRIPRDRLRIRRAISVIGDQLIEQVELRNFDGRPHTIELQRRAASHFHDIFEVRGMRRERRGVLQRPTMSLDRCELTLSYQGLDGHLYRTVIRSSEPASDVEIVERGGLLAYRHVLEPRATWTITWVVGFDSEPVLPVDLGVLKHVELVSERRRSIDTLQIPRFDFENPLLNAAIQQATFDIKALVTRRDGGLYLDAGIPWFCAPFGRDGLITAYQMLPWCPALAEGVLDIAFARLGQKIDSFTDEEPGKIFHESRYGEMARTREIPFIPYYGSVDSTPLALCLLASYASWTERYDRVQRWWESATAAVNWVLSKMRESPLGFLTYMRRLPTGLVNQGWKDSHDSVMHEDGQLAEPPIALCEAQGYAYRGLMGMSYVARRIGRGVDADRWSSEAMALRRRFRDRFWDEERGMIVLALDGAGKPCRVLASNQGHCLWSGIVDDEHAGRIATALLSREVFSGYGIRTLATSERAYNPLSYHNGSIWPHDNSLIAEGLRTYGCIKELRELAGGLFSVVEESSDSRLPELFCGYSRKPSGGPVPYEVACKPQAWAAGSLFLLIKALLGLKIDPDAGTILFKRPHLPPQAKGLTIRGLNVRGCEFDMHVRKGTLTATVEILHTVGGEGRVIVVN
jgi:glycogen debranching enzyme